MTRDEAWSQLVEFYRRQPSETDGQSLPKWLGQDPELVQLPTGDWLAMPRALLHHGVRLRQDGSAFHYLGALGKLVPKLGLPCSGELHLGSCRQGRYQLCDRGLGAWEDLKDVGDLGYPVATWRSVDDRARSCQALVAFFDLRGFTSWSARASAREVQDVIERFETAFQGAFNEPWMTQIFCKGTGDGFMVVSEACWYNESATEVSSEQALAFCRACAKTLRSARPEVPEELAIGCGVTCGQLTQLYLFGRHDYIGPEVNNASKIQAIAYDELCLSLDVVERLERDGRHIVGWPVPGKGRRVAVDAMLVGQDGAAGA
jgi:class 3 adenylate cyclase